MSRLLGEERILTRSGSNRVSGSGPNSSEQETFQPLITIDELGCEPARPCCCTAPPAPPGSPCASTTAPGSGGTSPIAGSPPNRRALYAREGLTLESKSLTTMVPVIQIHVDHGSTLPAIISTRTAALLMAAGVVLATLAGPPATAADSAAVLAESAHERAEAAAAEFGMGPVTSSEVRPKSQDPLNLSNDGFEVVEVVAESTNGVVVVGLASPVSQSLDSVSLMSSCEYTVSPGSVRNTYSTYLKSQANFRITSSCPGSSTNSHSTMWKDDGWFGDQNLDSNTNVSVPHNGTWKTHYLNGQCGGSNNDYWTEAGFGSYTGQGSGFSGPVSTISC